MAKKKSVATQSKTRKRGVKKDVLYQIKIIFGVVLFLFFLAAIFNAAGSLGGALHGLLQQLFGILTPGLAIVLIWVVARKYFPKVLTPRFPVAVGIVIFILALAGLTHSFAVGALDPAVLARQGGGGGEVGYAVYAVLVGALGNLIGRLILFLLVIVAIMLMFDRALLPYLRPEERDDDEEQDDMEHADSKVPVMGEIRTNTLGRFKRMAKNEEPAAVPLKKATPIPVLSRTANWNYPSSSLLDVLEMKPQAGNIHKRLELIQKTLGDFGIDVAMEGVNVGPTVTQYTLKPAEGVKLNQITARQDDLALSLAAQSLRVEAPIPGKGLVGVEIPNDKKAIVGMRELLESKQFKQVGSKLALALGRDAAGEPSVADLTRMPHCLIAGSTGSGKSVCINSIILTFLMNTSPDELRLILVDPKRVELTGYNGLPHLLTPVITEPKDTVAALSWAVREMERRYKLFASLGKRNIEQYNQEPDLGEGKLPFIVLIIDELADLMMVASREVEGSIVRLAQMARAVGIHLIVATQRPSVDVITGLIKANIPTRIAFAVASQIDSRTILDISGAEKLLGYGDMLYVSTDTPKPKRVQGVLVTEKEINSVIAHIKMQEAGDRYDPSVLETRVESRLGSSRENGEVDDDLFEEAYDVVRQAGKASSTLLQTRLSVGYARAARLIQIMEDKGLIGPAKGSKPREVYDSPGNDADQADGTLVSYGDNE